MYYSSFADKPHSFVQVRQLLDLKNIALGNARLLYGSEQRKFYGKWHSHESNQVARLLGIRCRLRSQ